MDEYEGTPQKKLRDSVHTDVYDNQERLIVVAEQHRWKQWIPFVGTIGELGTFRQFMRLAIMSGTRIPN